MENKLLTLDDVIANPFPFPLEKWYKKDSGLRWDTEARLVMPGETMKIADFVVSCYDYRDYNGYDTVKANEDKITYLASLVNQLDLSSRLSLVKAFIERVRYDSSYVTKKVLLPALVEIAKQKEMVKVDIQKEIFISEALVEVNTPKDGKVNKSDRVLKIIKACNLNLSLGISMNFDSYCNSEVLKNNLIWTLLSSVKYIKALSNNIQADNYEKFTDYCKNNFTQLILKKFNSGYEFKNINLAINELVLSKNPITEILDELAPLMKEALEKETFQKNEGTFLYKILNNIDFYVNLNELDKKIVLPYFEEYENSLKKDFFVEEKIGEDEVELKLNFVKLLRVLMLSSLNIDYFNISKDNKEKFMFPVDKNTNMDSKKIVTIESLISNGVFKPFFEHFTNQNMASWSVQEVSDKKKLEKSFVIKVKKEDVNFVKDLFMSYLFVPKDVSAYESHDSYNLVKLEDYIMRKNTKESLQVKKNMKKF